MKTLVGLVQQRSLNNGSQTLEFALSSLGKVLLSNSNEKVALSSDDELFKLFPINIFKKIMNKKFMHVKIIIYNPPKFITNTKDIDEILKNYHNSPIGGHIGQHRLYLKISEKYKWKDMKGTIAKFVNSCELCKKNKIIKHTKEKMVVTTTPTLPFEVVSIDTTSNNEK